jgi:hypothetical protein
MAIASDLEATFAFLFGQLRANGTDDLVRKFIRATPLTWDALHQAEGRAVDDAEAGE